MKTIAVLFSFLTLNAVVAQNDWATWDFLLNELEIIPSNPLPGQEVKVAYDIHTFMDVDYYGDNLNMTGNDIIIKSCMSVSMVPTNENFKDTLSLGILGAGTYSISFKVYGDYAPPYCDNYSTANDSVWRDTTFLVSLTNSIDNNEINDVLIYPNPTSDFILLTCGAEFEPEIKIVDELGRIVLEFESLDIEGNVITIDLRSLDTGVYFLFYDSSRRQFVSKIIKQ